MPDTLLSNTATALGNTFIDFQCHSEMTLQNFGIISHLFCSILSSESCDMIYMVDGASLEIECFSFCLDLLPYQISLNVWQFGLLSDRLH